MASRGKRIISGFFFRLFNTIASIVIAFFMMPFILHTLGDKMYGLWVFIGAFMGYMNYLDLGISSAVGRFVSRAIGRDDVDEVNTVISTSFILYLIIGVVVFLLTILLVICSRFFVQSPDELRIVRILILMAGLNLSIGFPTRSFGGVIHAHLRYEVTAGIRLTELLLRNILIVIFFNLGYRIVTLGFIVFCVSLLTYVLWIYFAFSVEKRLRLNTTLFDRRRIREIFSYGIYSFIGRLAHILVHRVDSVVIASFVGLSAVAHYSIAATLVTYFSTFLFRSLGLIGPVFSQDEGRGNYEEIRRKLLLTTKISIYMTCFIGAMVLLYGKHFIVRWMGADYVDAYTVLVILIPPTVIMLMQQPSTSVLYNISRHKFLAWSGALEGICNLILSILLVKNYGIVGVAIGTAIPMFVLRFCIQPIYVCHVLNISRWKYYINTLTTCIGIAFVSIIPIYIFMQHYALPDFVRLALIGSAHLGFYACVIYLIGFHKDERRYLLGFVKLNIQKSKNNSQINENDI